MEKKLRPTLHVLFMMLVFILFSCHNKKSQPDIQSINAINLTRGPVALCVLPGEEFGTVDFVTSCSDVAKKDFNLALALLHSFEYDEAEKVFAKTIDAYPDCAMAYWGVAMCNYHQVWPSPPSAEELDKGSKAISIAKAINQKTKREADYINAIGVFYQNWKTVDHRRRSIDFERALEKLYTAYPDDKEAAIFYALSLVATADPSDKSFNNQKKAGTILNGLYPDQPNHPGIVHYIIHTYDSPELANLALDAARKYASIAPASAHAQHMPSHIFTRLGLWDDCIKSNLRSMASAKCYAENAGIKGHWDEELHALDYLMYAYLQKAQADSAQRLLDYLKTIKEISPPSFKVAYAFAAMPSRYYLENHMWSDAANMELVDNNVSWPKFPWQKAIFHFARLMGSLHAANLKKAMIEIKNLHSFHDTLVQLKDPYKANQVMIQIRTGEAWILLNEKNPTEAVQVMREAADMEDRTEKSPVTPGEVIPAKELLGDMLLQLNKPAEALVAYKEDLKKHPNRFNGLYGAAIASERMKDMSLAREYFLQLTSVANAEGSKRPELDYAKAFLKKENF